MFLPMSSTMYGPKWDSLLSLFHTAWTLSISQTRSSTELVLLQLAVLRSSSECWEVDLYPFLQLRNPAAFTLTSTSQKWEGNYESYAMIGTTQEATSLCVLPTTESFTNDSAWKEQVSHHYTISERLGLSSPLVNCLPWICENSSHTEIHSTWRRIMGLFTVPSAWIKTSEVLKNLEEHKERFYYSSRKETGLQPGEMVFQMLWLFLVSEVSDSFMQKDKSAKSV